MTIMNRLTLMLIVGAALPIAAIAQSTTQTAPPSETASNAMTSDPAVPTPSDVTTNSTTPTDGVVELVVTKKKKPMNATQSYR
jgi:hypothetical protein